VDTTTLPERYAASRANLAEERLKREIRDSGLDPRLDLTVEVARGEAEKSIVDKASAIGANLIAMGLSHDVSWARMFRGTTIDRVVRQSQYPVLTVKIRPR
jgi:nucleotide-binding universal stress UspA family protein